MQRLTLQEMAERLRTTPKTFAAIVSERDVPFILVGKRKIFDPVAVEAHLAAVPDEKPTNIVHFRPKLKGSKTKPKSRLAMAAGI